MLPDALGWPKGWVKSYKWHLQSRDGEGPVPLPVDTFIVAFHGRPHPHEVKDGSWGSWKQAPWIADYWKVGSSISKQSEQESTWQTRHAS
jgi:hypothetical protein